MKQLLVPLRLRFRLARSNQHTYIETTLPEEQRWVGTKNNILWDDAPAYASDDVQARRALHALLGRLGLNLDIVEVPEGCPPDLLEENRTKLVAIDSLTIDQARFWVEAPLTAAAKERCSLEIIYDGEKYKGCLKIGERASFTLEGHKGSPAEWKEQQLAQKLVRWAARSYLLGYDAVHPAIRVARQDYRKDC